MTRVVDARDVDLALEWLPEVACQCAEVDPEDCCPRCTVAGLLTAARRFDAHEVVF